MLFKKIIFTFNLSINWLIFLFMLNSGIFLENSIFSARSAPSFDLRFFEKMAEKLPGFELMTGYLKRSRIAWQVTL